MENKKEGFDYEALKKKTLEQFRSGKSLFGKDGAFGPLLKDFLEAALQAEMEEHLDEEQRLKGNRKNGLSSKQLKTADGTIDLSTPRDRASEFDPQIVRKRETILAESLEQKIIGMYGHGMSLRDISAHIKDMYDTDISAATLSAITDKVIPLVSEWQSRLLDPLYCIVWLDAMYYKVKQDNKIITRCVYNILGITIEGKKEILGCYTNETEGANFWLSVRFAEAISTVFVKTEVQSCIVHQIRNSLKYIASKDQKEFMKELKPVYQAVSKEAAEMQLEKLSEKWREKYPVVIGSWQRNWEKLTTYFAYPEAIRKLIYTTNTIEGYHRQIRKVTKTKGAFTSDMALLKLIYLATQNIQKKWTQALPNWSITLSQLSIIFSGRLSLKL
jgi:transposase-like protein